MTEWRILVIDDDPEICEQVKEFIEATNGEDSNNTYHVLTETNFDKSLDLLESHRVDFVILDVRGNDIPLEQDIDVNDESGIRTLNQIKNRRFVPVIFYTGLAHKVKDLETPLVRVLGKGVELPELISEVKKILDTGIPALNRALIRHVEEQQRNYMWEFVANNYENFGDTDDKASLAYMLARRLAVSLSGSGIEKFIEELGETTAIKVNEDKVHPMQYYVFPPLENPNQLAGDIFKKKDSDDYYVLLTPSCDLVQCKAEWLLISKCTKLIESPEYKKWLDDGKDKNLNRLLLNNRDGQRERYFFLPGVLTLPDLIVDLQQLTTIDVTTLNENYDRIVSLDSPYAETLLEKFSRFFGRLGTPDLDSEKVINKLRKNLPSS